MAESQEYIAREEEQDWGERDALLLERANSGDEEAAEELINLYKPLVLSRASAYFLKGGDRDDLIQEAMIALFKAVKSCPKDRYKHFSSYAWTAVDRRLIDVVRADNRQKNRALNEGLSLEEPLSPETGESRNLRLGDIMKADWQSNPERLVLLREQMRQIFTFIEEKLSDLEEKVLMGIGRGASYKELAKSLGVTEKSVDGALQRARKKIQAFVDESSDRQ